jgi:hypothetical protein
MERERQLPDTCTNLCFATTIRKNQSLQRALVANIYLSAVLWNRNRGTVTFCLVEPTRNQNRTVTCEKVRTGTVINYGSGTVVKWYHISSHKPTV